MNPAAVSVPGKLILIGEHAAVYGRPALVAAVDLRMGVRIEALDEEMGDRIDLDLGLSHDGRGLGRFETSWREVLATTERAREAWRRFSESPGKASFVDTGAGDPASLVKVALGETAFDIGSVSGIDPRLDLPRGLALAVRSEIPMGSGFGSSAAAAVAVVSSYLHLQGGLISTHGPIADQISDRRRVRRLSLDVERRQHGLPSGIDNATVLVGGILSADRRGGDLQLTPISARARWLSGLHVVSTGRPNESTGEVVAAVRDRFDRDKKAIGSAIDRIEAATEILRAEVESSESPPDVVVHAFREAQSGLEALGVVPERVRQLVRQVEAEGGAAKISGAGTLTGEGAGTLLIYHPEAEQIDAWDFLSHLSRHAVALGADGARIEESIDRRTEEPADHV